MADIARLGFRVDTSQIRRANERLNRFSNSSYRAEQAVYGTAGAVQRSGGNFARASQSASTLAASIKGLAVAYGGLRAARAVMDSLGRQEEIGDLANQIGATTEYISEMGYVADQTGSSAESFNRGLERMSRRIGQVAQTSSGSAKRALESLGVSIRELENLNTEQQFQRIAEEIRGIDSSSRQAAVAQRIFGRSGVDLLNTINEGSGAIQRYRREAREAGLSLSEGMVGQAAAARQSMRSLGSTFEGITNTLANNLAPTIQAFSSVLADDIREGGQESGQYMVEWQKGMTTVITTVADVYRTGTNSIMTMLKTVGTTAAATAASATNAIKGDLEGAKIVWQDWQEDQSKIQSDFLNQNTRKYRDAGEKALKAFQSGQESERGRAANTGIGPPSDYGDDDGAGSSKSQRAIQNEQRVAEEGQRAALRFGEAWARAYNERMDAALSTLDQLRNREERAADERKKQLQAIQTASENGLIGQERAAELSERAWDRWGEAVEDNTQEASRFATRAADNIQDEIGDTLKNSLDGSFDGILKSWVDMLRDMAAEAAAQQIAGALFGEDFGRQGRGGNNEMGGLIGNATDAVSGWFQGGPDQGQQQSMQDAGIDMGSFMADGFGADSQGDALSKGFDAEDTGSLMGGGFSDVLSSLFGGGSNDGGTGSGLGGLAGMGIGGFFGGTGGAAAGGGIGDTVGGLFDGLFADGGTVRPGHWGIAGEEGPELIHGGRSGQTITPPHKMPTGDAGGTTLNVTVENNASGVRHEVQQIGPNDVRVIARQEISRETPRLMERELANSNSRSSKTLQRHTHTKRRRS